MYTTITGNYLGVAIQSMVDIGKKADEVRNAVENQVSNASNSLGAGAGEVQNIVESQVPNASTAVEGRKVEVRITDAEFEASANEDLSELKATIKKDIEREFGYDITVVVGIEAER